jgi:hypothetical protein
MRLSRDKIVHLANILVSALQDSTLTKLRKDKNELRSAIIKIITDELKVEEDIDREVKKTLSSYSRKIIEGSREWDILYQKTFDEFMKKRGRPL